MAPENKMLPSPPKIFPSAPTDASPQLNAPKMGSAQPVLPGLTFLASVALRFETPLNLGGTPNGVRIEFEIAGSIDGPRLKGRLPSSTAYLLVDPDGVGLLNVRAPFLLADGARAEIEGSGRSDFGSAGYERAAAADLPNSSLGWCPRIFSGHPRYDWLNHAQCLGVGAIRPKELRIDWDLFVVSPPSR
jgi:hypothetical protein